MPATVTQTLSITVRVTALGAVTNTATRQASAPVDPNPLNDSASASATPQLVADLAITKTPSAATVDAGAPLTWTLVVTNAGPSTATDATVTDTFAPAFTGVTWTCTATAGSSCGAASGVGAIATTVTLLAGGRATFVATTLIASSAIGPQANTATVTAPAGTTDLQLTNNSVTATVEVTASADLAITKTGPASLVPGTNVVYTITVTNAGPSDGAGVVVTDATPAGLTFVSNAGDCLTAFPCALGTVPAGATRVITTTFAVPAAYATPDPLVNTAAVATATPDPVPANNTSTVQTPVAPQADLAITKTGPASVVPGTNVVYTITVTNAGPSDAASVVRRRPDARRADLCVEHRRLHHGLPVRAGDGAGWRAAARDHGDLLGAGDLHDARSNREHGHGRDRDDRPGPGEQLGDGPDGGHSPGRPGDHEDRPGVGRAGHERGLHDHRHEYWPVGRSKRGRHR